MAREGIETAKRPRYITDVSTLGADLIAGLTNALVYIPQGIAYALVRSTYL
jgi:MFS superfamily sulfate permease-like transporter